MRQLRNNKYWSRKIIGFVVLVLIAVMMVFVPGMFSYDGIVRASKQISVEGVVAIGTAFILISGCIDISGASIAGLCGVVGAMLACPYGIGIYIDKSAGTGEPLPLIITIVVPILLGMLFGLASGILRAKLKIPSVISTMAIGEIAKGLANLLTSNSQIYTLTDEYKAIANSMLGPVPLLPIYFLIIFLCALVLLKCTMFGRFLYAIGGNEIAAINIHIDVAKVRTLSFAFAGALYGIAGVLLSSRLQHARPDMAEGYEVDAFAACFLGGVAVRGGHGSLWGVLIGVVFIGMLSYCLNVLGVASSIKQIVRGMIIVLVVIPDMIRDSRRSMTVYKE